MRSREWVPVTMPWESEVKVRKLGGMVGAYNVSRYSRYKEEWLARGRDSKGNSLLLGLYKTRGEAVKVVEQHLEGEKNEDNEQQLDQELGVQRGQGASR